MTWDTIEAKEFYFVDEVAEILRMDKASVRRLIRLKKLPKYQDGPGAKLRIRHRDLEACLERMFVDVEPEKEKPARKAGKEKAI